MDNEEEIQERTKRIEEMLGQLVKSFEEMDGRLRQLETNTKGVVSAFDAASGAFVFLEALAKIVKPIAFITLTVGGFILWLKGVK
jgi:DNA anti-recombination protein RmuC